MYPPPPLTLARPALQALIDAHPEARATIMAEAEERAGALAKLPQANPSEPSPKGEQTS